MLNWNIIPLFYGPALPYCLFTETEWIGKLAYMINDHDEKINTLIETVDNIVNVELPNIKLRLDDIETVEIPGIKLRLDDIETVEIPGIKTRLNDIETVEIPGIKTRLNDIETVEIPGIKSRLDAAELDIDTINNRSWVYVLKINNPIYDDDNNIRTYTLPIVTGYNYANFSCILNCDHITNFSVSSKIPVNITIPIGDNVDRTINVLDFAEPGEYGTPGMITNKITFNSDISFTISFGIDKFINFTSTHTIDDLELPTLEDICVTYLKRPSGN